MTDVAREFETLVAQNPTAAHYAVPRDMAVALLALPTTTDFDGRAVDTAGMIPTTPDDLLGTVRWALRSHSERLGDKCPCSVCDAVLSEDQQLVADWLLALVARVEQAEAELLALRSLADAAGEDGCRPVSFPALCDSIDSKDTEEHVYSLVMHHVRRRERAESALAALRQRHAEKEKP